VHTMRGDSFFFRYEESNLRECALN
jgi:hypothetical protein